MNLVLGIQHLALIILELRRGEAFGVDKCLLALVIRGRQAQISLGDFDVVSENVVESNLQRLDARALPFARFDLGDELFAIAAFRSRSSSSSAL